MKNKTLGKALFAAAMVTGLLGAFSAPAQADDWHRHDHDRGHGYQREAREWHHGPSYGHPWYWHDRYYYYRPVIVRQPVVYAQPLFVEEPAMGSYSSFNITIPLNFD